MYGVMVTLTAGRCMADLLELRNEYRAAHRGELPMVILYQGDYDLLCGEYPVRNYGNIVHGMRVVVLRESPVVKMPHADQWSADALVAIKSYNAEHIEINRIPEYVEPSTNVVITPKANIPRKKPGRPAKGHK